MSYRDWGRGEGGPRARRSTASWSPPDADPVDPQVPDEPRRAPGRRRSWEREQEEPVDAYLPRWALESGVRRADGGGRHAAPDDDDEVVRPRSGGGRRAVETTGGGDEARATAWQELPAAGGPGSDHTGEWTFDRPQEQGYVGSRRADPVEDEPVSGSVVVPRPRRASSSRPQVIWSGVEESSATDERPARREPERRARRALRPVEESWSRPAADPWDRAARPAAEEAAPAYPPAVDPWDASGVHAWPAAGGTDRWDATGTWEQPDNTGSWERPDDTGAWERPDSTGQWERYADAGRWDRTEPPRSRRDRADESRDWAGRDEGFWSGTRLAGDDPRWMDPPTSAPRSPAITYAAPRGRPAGYGAGRRPADPIGAPRGTGRPAVRRRLDTLDSAAWARRLEDDLLDPDPGGPLRPLLYTAACYLIPAVLIFAWLLTLDARPPAGCVTDITGGGCDSPRAHALGSLVAGAPRFALALASSLVVAALLRRVGTTWRATTIALASAVVGGGLSTVLISVVTGQPIG